jgi:hypothetical protein
MLETPLRSAPTISHIAYDPWTANCLISGTRSEIGDRVADKS